MSNILRLDRLPAVDEQLISSLSSDTENELRTDSSLVSSFRSNSNGQSNALKEKELIKPLLNLEEFLAADIPEPEEIVYGTRRGELAMLVAITNVGKTTLVLNLALRLAAGESYEPLTPSTLKTRRVLYCDFESSPSLLKARIRQMLKNIKNESVAGQNFIPLSGYEHQGRPLSLSSPKHLHWLRERANEKSVDLIIIDTIGAAVRLTNENNNAEVYDRILNPLKSLAMKTNAAVLFCHHTGKPNETSSRVPAYAGRGASAFGAAPSSIFTLVASSTEGIVKLHCTKAKGPKFEPVGMRLNQNFGWFEPLPQDFQPEGNTPLHRIVAFINSKGKVRRKEIVKQFDDIKIGVIKNRLKEARRKRLIKPRSESPNCFYLSNKYIDTKQEKD